MSTMTPGIDVSHWQGSVNWAAVKSAGTAFAFAKATESASDQDAQFAANWAGMQGAGLLRGAYHFFHTSQDAASQANFFMSVVNSNGGFLPVDLPPVLDFEQASLDQAMSVAAVQSAITTWLQTVAAKIGVTPMIYTNLSMGTEYLSGQFGSFPLWIASYNSSPPAPPSGWTNWQFWQYSQSGTIAGVSGNVDLDYFNGSQQQLLAFVQSPATASQTASSSGTSIQTYTVKSGDTLSEIAAQYGVTTSELAAANGIQNADLIYPGQVLQIPQSS